MDRNHGELPIIRSRDDKYPSPHGNDMTSFAAFIAESEFAYWKVLRETRSKIEATFGKPTKIDDAVSRTLLEKLGAGNIPGYQFHASPHRPNPFHVGFYVTGKNQYRATPTARQKGKYLFLEFEFVNVESSNALLSQVNPAPEAVYTKYVVQAKEFRRILKTAGFDKVWLVGSAVVVGFLAADLGYGKSNPERDFYGAKMSVKLALRDADSRADFRDGDPDNELSVRYWGTWTGDDGSGDYDWQELDPSWLKKAVAIARAAEKKFPGLKVRVSTGEKNYLYFYFS